MEERIEIPGERRRQVPDDIQVAPGIELTGIAGPNHHCETGRVAPGAGFPSPDPLEDDYCSLCYRARLDHGLLPPSFDERLALVRAGVGPTGRPLLVEVAGSDDQSVITEVLDRGVRSLTLDVSAIETPSIRRDDRVRIRPTGIASEHESMALGELASLVRLEGRIPPMDPDLRTRVRDARRTADGELEDRELFDEYWSVLQLQLQRMQ